MQKNVASQYIAFNAVSSTDGSAITTGTPVVKYTIDGGTQATSTNTAVHEGDGQWSLALTQAETNGSHIVYTMTLTGAINSLVQAYPITLSDFMADVSGLATASSISALNNFDPTSDPVIVGTNNDKTDYVLSSGSMAAVIDGVWDEPQSGHTTVGTFGYYLDDQVSAAGGGGTAPTEAEIYTYFTSSSRQDTFKADVSSLATSAEIAGLNDFDPAVDVVARVTLVDTTTTNTDMVDVSTLATSADITALNDFDPTTDVVARVTLVDTTTTNTDMVSVAGLATSSEIAALNDFDPAVDVVARVTLVDTTTTNTDMVDVAGLATSAEITALNDISAADVYAEFTSGSNEDAFKADVTGLATAASITALNDFDPTTDVVARVTLVDTTTTNTDMVDVSSLATSADIAGLNDFDPATDTVARVTLVDTTTTNTDMVDVSLLATSAEIAALNDFDPAVDVVANVTLVDTTTNLTNGGGGTAPTEAQIYTYFTSASREDAFKADVSALALEATVQTISNDIAALDVLLTTVVVVNQVAMALDLDDVKLVTDKLDTTLQADGTDWQYTISALENAPAGGGGGGTDWSVVEREQIRYRLGVDGNTDVPATNNPDLARNTTAQTVIDALTVEIDGLNDFNPATDTVARVTLVDTTTTNTDMVDVSGLATSAEIAALNDVSAEDVYLYFTSGINADSFKADVAGLASQASIDALNDFDPTTDVVARVTLVDTTTTNTDMVDVSGLALEASVQALNDISASDVYTLFTTGSNADQFKADTTLLATAASISALNDFDPAVDVVARVTLVDTTTTNTDMVDVSGLASQASVDALNNITVQQVVDGVWDEQQSLHTTAGSFGAYLDGEVTAAGGDDAATIYTFFTAGSNEDAFKANVSGLATQTSVDALPTAGDIYTQFVAGSNADAFKADVSLLALQTTLTSLNDLSGSEVASAVWDAVQTNHTTAGTFGFYLDSTVSTAGGGSMTPSDIYDYFTDLTRADEFKADVSGLAQEASVTALPSAAETYTYFTTGNRPDPFHADITALATAAQITALNDFNPTTDVVAQVTLVDTTTTNVDMVDISGLATTVRIDQLNDFNPATDVVMNVDTVQNVVNIGQGLNGPSVLTVTVSDGSNPIENAQVVAKRTGESGFKVTDSNGQVQFAVSDATYDLVVISAGYEGVVDSVVVSGTTGKAITMSATVLPTPSQPELCVVACYIQLNGQPVENATVRATLVNSNSAVDGVVLSNAKDIEETDINGYAQLELVRLDQFVDGDGRYLIEVFDGNNKLWSTTSTIPNTGAINLEDLV